MLAAHARGDLVALRTSGTSGSPRSVVRSTRSWFDSFAAVTMLLGMGPDSRLWLPGPLSATMNLFAAVHAADLGATVDGRPTGASHAALTPARLVRAIAQGVDLTGVHVLVAGDRLTRSQHDLALAHGASRVSHYYGAAELSFVAWGAHADDLAAFPGVEVESRDGQLWVRSPYLMRRYDGPDGPFVRGDDGFATVGDRGEVTQGRVRVTGRGTDTIVTAGATVLAADVEATVEAATGRSLTVVGVPHPDLGEVVCAVVTRTQDVAPLRDAARTLLDPPQRPRRWFLLDEVPLTPAGKVDRVRLAELLAGAVPLAAP